MSNLLSISKIPALCQLRWIAALTPLVWAVPSICMGADESSARSLFHLTFDDGFTAKAAGDGRPTNADHLPMLVEGHSGKGAFFEPGRYLRYLTKGNLNKERGSLAMWVQAPVDGAGAINQRYTLFSEEAPNKAGDDKLWAWLQGGTNFRGGNGLRFDVRDPKDKYAYVPPAADWRKGEWHHVLFTWNHQLGTAVFVDGEPATSTPIPAWSAKTYPAFFLGALDQSGQQPWAAAIDDVSIFDRELTADEARREYLKTGQFQIKTKLVDPFLTAGQKEVVKVELRNPDTAAKGATQISYELADEKAQIVQSGTWPDQTLAPGQRILLKIPLNEVAPGRYPFTLKFGQDAAPQMVKGIVEALPAQESLPQEPVVQKLVAEIVPTKPTAESGGTRVVNSPLGAYLEAGPQRHDRFALSFKVQDLDALHMAVITYPDDKPRTMEMVLQDFGVEDYQAHNGVFTGNEYPLSQSLREHRIYFWPHAKDQTLIFMTAEKDHPAAVAGVKIYRLDHFKAPERPVAFKGSVPAREIGLYYEDPVLNQNYGLTTDWSGFAESTTRLLDYMASMNQNVLLYPMAWYAGPLYGTSVEPFENHKSNGLGGIRPHPDGWFSYLLKRLNARGMKFNAGVHIHELPSLKPFIVLDPAKIAQGTETVVNIRGDGAPWFGHWHGSDPNYNPADPRVMASVRGVVDEIAERYGSEPAFMGVTLVMARNKLFTFGSLESGYNDGNLLGFQKDTGTKIPVYQAGDPQRFAKSYQWLMQNAEIKKAWIDWRCRVLHDHYQRMAEALAAKRGELTLTLNIFTPWAFYSRVGDYLTEPAVETMKEAGIDPALYRNDAHIVLSYTFMPSDYRWQRAARSEWVPASRTSWTAPEVVDSLASLPRASALIHDRYWEDDVAKNQPLMGLIDGKNGRELSLRRVTVFNATDVHAMEPYVMALNNLDALQITKGGFSLGTRGLEEFLGRFSRAYQALPAVKFDDIAELADPVRVRQKVVDQARFFYVLNRLPEPVDVRLSLAEAGEIEEPSSGDRYKVEKELTLRLAPFELRAFRSASGQQAITGGKIEVPADWLAQLEARLNRCRQRTNSLPEQTDGTKITPYLLMAEQCWKDGHYARLYFLLQEDWAATLLGEKGTR